MVIESAGLAQKRAQEGYTYQAERGFDVAEKVAQNEGTGNFSNMGIGLGMMGGVAGGMGAVVAGITTDALHQASPQQEGAKSDVPTSVAGGGVVTPAMSSESKTQSPVTTEATSIPDKIVTFQQKLEQLKLMKEANMVSEEEYESKRKELLNSI